jgi:YegS/Rv2252/BmrU family lipid kinase
MISVLVVINPKAGTKTKKNLEEIIKKFFEGKGIVEFLYWQSADEDITEKVKRQIRNRQYDTVVVCGGDGTVNRVSQALLYGKEKLAIIPIGSGNGLARHLNIGMNIKKALKVAIYGKVKEIDAVRINENYYFCTAGVGFDAQVAHLFANAEKRGLLTYVRMVLVSFFNYKPKNYFIKCDDIEFKTEAFFITVANANQWGNNVKVAPLANISDGLFNLVILKSFKWYHLPSIAFRLLTNSFHLSKRVLNLTGKVVSIKFEDKEIQGHFDGEPVMFSEKVVCRIENKALKVIVP